MLNAELDIFIFTATVKIKDIILKFQNNWMLCILYGYSKTRKSRGRTVGIVNGCRLNN
jgi:hypothetical protein